MATSGALSTSNSYVKYKITITQNSQDVSGNKSNVTVKVNFYRTNTGYTTYGTGKVYCRINGTLYSADVKPSQKITSSGIDLFTKTLNIAHSADGTKTLSVSAWIDHNAPLTSSEQSYSQTLTTIARASQPSCITWPEHTQNVGEFGDTISIHTNRKSDSFTHTLRYQFGSRSGTIATGVGTGTQWKIPVELIDLIPSAVTGSGTIYCDTYNGSTKIGTKSCGFTATVPASVIPTCSIQVLDDTDTKDTYGNLVKGLSKLYIKTTGAGVYSSTIDSYSVVADGLRYTRAEVTTEALRFAGTVTVQSTVTDTRGRTSKAAEASFPVLDYEKPIVTSLTVHRCNEDGTEDENGEWVRVEFSASVTPLNNKNHAVYTLRYTNNTTGAVVEEILSDIANQYEVDGYTKIFAADGNSSYSVEIIAKDDIYRIQTGTSVSTAFSLYNCHTSGTGWAFGKVSEEEKTLENSLALKQTGNRYCMSTAGVASQSGYVCMARLTHIAASADTPITFVFTRRLEASPMTVHVQFRTDSTTVDPDLKGITYEGSNYGAFLVKVDTSVWDLYVQKVSAYDTITLQDWYTTRTIKGRLNVTFPANLVSELPQGLVGWYRATPLISRSILDAFMPVGYVLILYSHANPNEMYAGTSWERIANSFLWGCDEDGEIGITGGEKTHTLTVKELPKHTHNIAWTDSDGNTGGTGTSQSHPLVRYGTTGVGYTGILTLETGGGAAHNNMPPYVQVSIWRRTA